jgi:hypothetical protein
MLGKDAQCVGHGQGLVAWPTRLPVVIENNPFRVGTRPLQALPKRVYPIQLNNGYVIVTRAYLMLQSVRAFHKDVLDMVEKR